jgi:hypothetical protein
MFPKMYGNFKDPRNLLREFYRDQKVAKVRMITFHDLRHYVELEIMGSKTELNRYKNIR